SVHAVATASSIPASRFTGRAASVSSMPPSLRAFPDFSSRALCTSPPRRRRTSFWPMLKGTENVRDDVSNRAIVEDDLNELFTRRPQGGIPDGEGKETALIVEGDASYA